MAGKARARRGLVRIVGKAAWAGVEEGERVQVSEEGRKAVGVSAEFGEGGAEGAELDTRGDLRSRGPEVSSPSKVKPAPWSDEAFPVWVERRALVFYPWSDDREPHLCG